MGFPGGTMGKEPACQCRRCKRCRFDPWVRKIPWRMAWQSTPVSLPGESHGERSLVSYSPKRCTKLDTVEVTQHALKLIASKMSRIMSATQTENRLVLKLLICKFVSITTGGNLKHRYPIHIVHMNCQFLDYFLFTFIAFLQIPHSHKIYRNIQYILYYDFQ